MNIQKVREIKLEDMIIGVIYENTLYNGKGFKYVRKDDYGELWVSHNKTDWQSVWIKF